MTTKILEHYSQQPHEEIYMTANDLNFTNQKFSKSEWPDGCLEWLHPKIISALFDIRNALPAKYAMIPSPVFGAHVRHDGSTSRHSTANMSRLSTATDVFMSWDHVSDAILEAYRHPSIGGLGIYTDHMLRGERGDFAMLHLDCRPKERFLQWVGWRTGRSNDTMYTYFHLEPKRFFELLHQRGKF